MSSSMSAPAMRALQSLILALLPAVLAACGGGSNSGSDSSATSSGSASSVSSSSSSSSASSSSSSASSAAPAASTLAAPATINLYPGPHRFFVKLMSVGSVSANLPLNFDTGSAGVTIHAESVFPASMVTTSGFVFPTGQTSISYQGVTVTDQQAVRTYGTDTANETTEHGNVGYATVTFGDSTGTLTTATMPIFFYYSLTRVSTGDEVTGDPEQGVFGVNDVPNPDIVSGSSNTSAIPLCAPDTTGTCYEISPLKYLTYGNGVHGGFMLAPTALQTCDITTAGSCVGKPVLTVGLTPALEDGFTTEDLTCPPANYTGPQLPNGYPVCVQAIANSTIALSGTATGTETTAALFDTGTPDMLIAVPSGTSFPASVPAGTDVLVTLPSGFTYSYTADTGTYASTIYTGTETIIGLGYFTTHAYFVDFTSSTAGFK